MAVKRSSLAQMRRTPQENVFREISVMVSERTPPRPAPPRRSVQSMRAAWSPPPLPENRPRQQIDCGAPPPPWVQHQRRKAVSSDGCAA